jgi:dolichol-phosphate mannosyltransferase
VIAPLHDEQDNVRPLVGEVIHALSKLDLPWEVILVDDGSGDATALRLAEARAACPALQVVSLPVRAGQSAATCAGVRAARMSHIATLDGDLQNDPADLLPMLLACAGSDAVIGRRIDRRDPLGRRLAGRCANAVRRLVLRDGAADTGCSLKIFPREPYLALPRFDGMHRFLPALLRMQGLRIAEVPVSHRERHRGRSKYTNAGRLGRTLLDLLGVLWLSRRVIRLPAETSPPAEPAAVWDRR